jgi:hypothetical protein
MFRYIIDGDLYGLCKLFVTAQSALLSLKRLACVRTHAILLAVTALGIGVTNNN